MSKYWHSFLTRRFDRDQPPRDHGGLARASLPAQQDHLSLATVQGARQPAQVGQYRVSLQQPQHPPGSLAQSYRGHAGHRRVARILAEPLRSLLKVR